MNQKLKFTAGIPKEVNIMKKVLLLYSEQFRNLDLSVIADLLRNVLNEKSIECEIKSLQSFDS